MAARHLVRSLTETTPRKECPPAPDRVQAAATRARASTRLARESARS